MSTSVVRAPVRLSPSVVVQLPCTSKNGHTGRQPSASLNRTFCGVRVVRVPSAATSRVSTGSTVVFPVPRGDRSLGP